MNSPEHSGVPGKDDGTKDHEPVFGGSESETLVRGPDKPDKPQTRVRLDTLPEGVRRIGKYQILSELGRGGMGIVYKARHIDLGKIVALKTLPLGISASEPEISRFLNEARAAAALDHPGIVQVHDVGEEEGLHYFAMDFVEGKSLDRVIGKESLSPRRALEITRDMAHALDFAHKRGVLHRDIKPANIFLNAGGKPLLGDFGLAKRTDSSVRLTQSGAVLGTPSYMSPEQAEGSAGVDARSDVYSLGAVLYEMITGKPPFEGTNTVNVIYKVLNDDPQPPRRFNRNVHKDIETICLKCLEKDSRRRYQGAAELGADVDRYLNGEPIAARPSGVAFAVWKKVRRSPALSAALIASILLLIGLLTLAFGPGRLSVTTNPPGALVRIDGELHGQADGQLSILAWPPGERRVMLSMEGYETEVRETRIRALANEKLEISMYRESGYLELSGDLAGLTTRASQAGSMAPPREFTVSGGQIRLETGLWRVSFEKENHFGRETEVEIRKGRPARVTVFLDPMLLWSVQTEGRIESSTAVADLDGDGSLEVAATSLDGRVYAIAGDTGKVKWSRYCDSEIYCSPAAADLDGDGRIEVVTATRGGTQPGGTAVEALKLVVLDGQTGDSKWTFMLPEGAEYTRPAIADLDSDGCLDVVVALRRGTVMAISGKSRTELWRRKTGKESLGVENCPAIGDFNCDGIPDVVVLSRECSLQVLSGTDGSVVWKRGFAPGGGQVGSPALGNFDGDSIPDIVIGTFDRKVFCLSGRDGSDIWSCVTGRHVPSTAEIADLDGDGRPDVAIGSGDNCVYAMSGTDGRLLWKFRTGYEVWGHLASFDITGDGVPDVLSPSDDSCVYALDGRTGAFIWRFRTGNQVVSAIEVADLDTDGVAEAVFTSKDGCVYAVTVGRGRRLRWRFKTTGHGYLQEAGDMNRDGAGDLAFGSADGYVQMLSGKDGSPVWKVKVDSNPYVAESPGDLDGDGVRDAAVSTPYGDGIVRVISGASGNTIWTCTSGCNYIFAGPDLNKDGLRDILASGRAGSVNSRQGDASGLIALSGKDGTFLWRWGNSCTWCAPGPDADGDGVKDVFAYGQDCSAAMLGGKDGIAIWNLKTDCPIYRAVFVPDINGDGTADLVTCSMNGTIASLSGRNGSRIWNSGLEKGEQRWIEAVPDLDGDGAADIATVSGPHEVMAFSGRSGRPIWKQAVSHTQAPLSGDDIDGDGVPDLFVSSLKGFVLALSGRDGEPLWRHAVGLGDRYMCICDLDMDGVKDVAISSSNGIVCAFDGRLRKPLGIRWSFSKWRQEGKPGK